MRRARTTRTTFWRRSATTLLAFALVATACGDGDDAADPAVDESTDAPSTTAATTEDGETHDAADDAPVDDEVDASGDDEALERTASWAGVTADTIRLGFIQPDFDGLREMGLVDLNRGDRQVVVDALVAELNGRGGILGRQIEPHLELVLPVGTTDADASCLRLTEDLDVFAVLGSFQGLATSANSCFTEVNEVVQVGGVPSPDQLERAAVPWLSVSMSAERRMRAALALMAENDLFQGDVAVVVAAIEEELGDDIVLPQLAELGIEVADYVVRSGDGDDPTAAAAAWIVQTERFLADGIDTVVLVDGVAVFGANQLVLNGFEGDILLVEGIETQLPSLGTSGDNPPEDLEGIVGTVAITPEQAIASPETQRCIEIVEAFDPTIEVVRSDEVADGAPDWLIAINGICRQLRTFELAATAAGVDLTPTSFQTGAESLGEVELPGVVAASFGPDKWDGGDALGLAEFDPTVGDTGGIRLLGSIERVTF